MIAIWMTVFQTLEKNFLKFRVLLFRCKIYFNLVICNLTPISERLKV